MFKLNLLPPQLKKELELTELGQWLASFGLRLATILIIFTLILVTTYFSIFILIKTQNDLIEERKGDQRIQHQAEIENKIEQVNEQARQIFIKQDQIITWIPLLEELSQVTPSGVYLINFSFRAIDNQINLTGWARDRDRLLRFEELLNESPYFDEINVPLTNLIKQTDINFNFTLKPKE